MSTHKHFICALLFLFFVQTGFTQNVGIGTTTPQQDLHVNGTTQTNYLEPGFKPGPYEHVRFGNPSAYWAGFMKNIDPTSFGNGDDFTIFTYDNRDLVLKSGTGHVVLHPTNGGNVGIGTTAPSQKLSVANGHISVSAEYGLVRGFGSGSEYAYLPNAAGITAMGGIGPNAPIDYGTQIRSDRLVAFIETDADKVSGWMDLNNNRFTWNGLISSARVKIQTNVWADYVFKEGYQLKSLNEIEQYIQTNGHLPNVPNEATVVKEGIDVSEMTIVQQEKIEELFLHMIELNKRLEVLENKNEKLEQENNALKQQIDK